MRTRGKLGLLASLYLSQGLPFGLFTQALPAILRRRGLSLTLVGLSSLLALPWALKPLWAPLVDRHGRRRSWILPLQLAAAALMAALTLFDPRHGLSAVLTGVLLSNLLAASQDIATDGLAVDLLRPEERGLGNGVQVAGYRVGMIVGGGGLLLLYDRAGWWATTATGSALLLIATLPILLHREPRRSPPAGDVSLLGALRRPGMRSWLVVLASYKAGDALATSMIRPLLVDLGLSLSDIGWLLGTVGFGAGLLGALLGGWAAGRLGRRRTLLCFGLLQAAGVAGYLLPATGSLNGLALVCGFEHLAGGMATAALFTAMMDRSRPASGATDYTLQASVVVLATGAMAALGGIVAQRWGYTTHFVLSALLCLAGAAAMWREVRSDRVGQQGEPGEQEADHPALGQREQRGTTRRRAEPA